MPGLPLHGGLQAKQGHCVAVVVNQPYMGWPFLGGAIIGGGPTDSAHHNYWLRGKGQPLEGNLERTA
jgi:hypothetical protein